MTKSINIKAGENLFDAAIRMYGDMSGLLHLVEFNNVGFTDEIRAGQVISGDDISFEKKTVNVILLTEIIPNSIEVEAGQSLFDIAVQEYGSIEGLFHLTQDNNLSLTEELEPAKSISVRTEASKQNVVDFFKGRNLKPATGLTPTENEQLKPEGIEYWAIEYDFVVS